MGEVGVGEVGEVDDFWGFDQDCVIIVIPLPLPLPLLQTHGISLNSYDTIRYDTGRFLSFSPSTSSPP